MSEGTLIFDESRMVKLTAFDPYMDLKVKECTQAAPRKVQ